MRARRDRTRSSRSSPSAGRRRSAARGPAGGEAGGWEGGVAAGSVRRGVQAAGDVDGHVRRRRRPHAHVRGDRQGRQPPRARAAGVVQCYGERVAEPRSRCGAGGGEKLIENSDARLLDSAPERSNEVNKWKISLIYLKNRKTL